MLKKQVFCLLIISFIPFVLYLQKPLMNGFDGYGYNSYNCNTLMEPHLVDNLITPASKFVFQLMPCSMFWPKIVLWFLFFLTLIVFGLIGELFDLEYGWLYGLFGGLCTIFVSSFFELEEMTFGYPLIFLAEFFVLKYVKGKQEFYVSVDNERNKWFALACVLLAGLFWKGSIIFLFWLGLILPGLVVVVLPVVLLYGWRLVHMVIIPRVIESLPLVGLVYLFFFNYFWFWIPRVYWKFLLPLLFLMLVSVKYTLFVLPFLLVGVAQMVNSSKRKKVVLRVLVGVSLVGFVLAGVNGLSHAPNLNEIELIEFAVCEADGNKIFNEWSFGYWVFYFGGSTNFFAGGINPDYNSVKGIIITSKDEDVNAVSLLVGDKLKVWRK